jgi:hypothetical protein
MLLTATIKFRACSSIGESGVLIRRGFRVRASAGAPCGLVSQLADYRTLNPWEKSLCRFKSCRVHQIFKWEYSLNGKAAFF